VVFGSVVTIQPDLSVGIGRFFIGFWGRFLYRVHAEPGRLPERWLKAATEVFGVDGGVCENIYYNFRIS